MYIDVVNIFRGEPCILECIGHHQLSTQPIRVSSREVVSISREAGTYELSVDVCTTSDGVLELLDDEASSTFGHDEAITRSAEGARSTLRIVIASGEGIHRIESTDTCSADRGFSTTSDDDVGLTEADEVAGIDQCVRRRSTGRSRGVVGPVETILHRHLTCRDIRDHLGDEEGIEARTCFGVIAAHFLFKGPETTDTGGDDDPDTVLIYCLYVKLGIGDTLFGCHHGKLSIAI